MNGALWGWVVNDPAVDDPEPDEENEEHDANIVRRLFRQRALEIGPGVELRDEDEEDAELRPQPSKKKKRRRLPRVVEGKLVDEESRNAGDEHNPDRSSGRGDLDS